MPHIIFTKPNQERRAITNLTRQGYRAFLPLFRKHPNAEPSPLFPRYLFFWVPEDMPWGPIANTPGVSKILKQTDYKPAYISETIIESIKTRMTCDGGSILIEDTTQKKRTFYSGQIINVIGGTHAGMSGLYVSSKKDRVTALFHMFGRQVKATVEESHLA